MIQLSNGVVMIHNFNIPQVLSFDDVLLVPKYSPVDSRSEVNTSVTLSSTINLKVPIISANMSTVTEYDMCVSMAEMGGMGIIHRMMPSFDVANIIHKFTSTYPSYPIGFSFGVSNNWYEDVSTILDSICSPNVIACLDVAHADSKKVANVLQTWYLNSKLQKFPIIIGNIATSDSITNLEMNIPYEFRKYVTWKIGIGGGSLCTTRIVTGFGVPTLHSVMDCWKNFEHEDHYSFIADGGIKNSGDIVKALSAGATAVMVGSLLAGTNEAPGNVILGHNNEKYKIYRGSASFGDKVNRGENPNNVEGVETLVKYKGSAKEVINSLIDGIRSGCSYAGTNEVTELKYITNFVHITHAGLMESKPHGKL